MHRNASGCIRTPCYAGLRSLRAVIEAMDDVHCGRCRNWWTTLSIIAGGQPARNAQLYNGMITSHDSSRNRQTFDILGWFVPAACNLMQKRSGEAVDSCDKAARRPWG